MGEICRRRTQERNWKGTTGGKRRKQKGGITPKLLGIDASALQWGPGQNPGGKTNFMYFSLHRALLVDRYSNILQLCDTTLVGWSYQLGGKTFPPGPTWRQFVSIPPLWKALLFMYNFIVLITDSVVVVPITAGKPLTINPSPRYCSLLSPFPQEYRKNCPHYRGNTAVTEVLPQSPSPCQPLVSMQYKPGQSGVHLVPSYNTNSRFVWNNYDKTAWLCHKISITKHRPYGK